MCSHSFRLNTVIPANSGHYRNAAQACQVSICFRPQKFRFSPHILQPGKKAVFHLVEASYLYFICSFFPFQGDENCDLEAMNSFVFFFFSFLRELSIQQQWKQLQQCGVESKTPRNVQLWRATGKESQRDI